METKFDYLEDLSFVAHSDSRLELAVLPEVLCDNLIDSCKKFPWLTFEPRISLSIPLTCIQINVFSSITLTSVELVCIRHCLLTMGWYPEFDLEYDVVKRCFVLTFYA